MNFMCFQLKLYIILIAINYSSLFDLKCNSDDHPTRDIPMINNNDKPLNLESVNISRATNSLPKDLQRYPSFETIKKYYTDSSENKRDRESISVQISEIPVRRIGNPELHKIPKFEISVFNKGSTEKEIESHEDSDLVVMKFVQLQENQKAAASSNLKMKNLRLSKVQSKIVENITEFPVSLKTSTNKIMDISADTVVADSAFIETLPQVTNRKEAKNLRLQILNISEEVNTTIVETSTINYHPIKLRAETIENFINDTTNNDGFLQRIVKKLDSKKDKYLYDVIAALVNHTNTESQILKRLDTKSARKDLTSSRNSEKNKQFYTAIEGLISDIIPKTNLHKSHEVSKDCTEWDMENETIVNDVKSTNDTKIVRQNTVDVENLEKIKEVYNTITSFMSKIHSENDSGKGRQNLKDTLNPVKIKKLYHAFEMLLKNIKFRNSRINEKSTENKKCRKIKQFGNVKKSSSSSMHQLRYNSQKARQALTGSRPFIYHKDHEHYKFGKSPTLHQKQINNNSSKSSESKSLNDKFNNGNDFSKAVKNISQELNNSKELETLYQSPSSEHNMTDPQKVHFSLTDDTDHLESQEPKILNYTSIQGPTSLFDLPDIHKELMGAQKARVKSTESITVSRTPAEVIKAINSLSKAHQELTQHEDHIKHTDTEIMTGDKNTENLPYEPQLKDGKNQESVVGRETSVGEIEHGGDVSKSHSEVQDKKELAIETAYEVVESESLAEDLPNDHQKAYVQKVHQDVRNEKNQVEDTTSKVIEIESSAEDQSNEQQKSDVSQENQEMRDEKNQVKDTASEMEESDSLAYDVLNDNAKLTVDVDHKKSKETANSMPTDDIEPREDQSKDHHIKKNRNFIINKNSSRMENINAFLKNTKLRAANESSYGNSFELMRRVNKLRDESTYGKNSSELEFSEQNFADKKNNNSTERIGRRKPSNSLEQININSNKIYGNNFTKTGIINDTDKSEIKKIYQGSNFKEDTIQSIESKYSEDYIDKKKVYSSKGHEKEDKQNLANNIEHEKTQKWFNGSKMYEHAVKTSGDQTPNSQNLPTIKDQTPDILQLAGEKFLNESKPTNKFQKNSRKKLKLPRTVNKIRTNVNSKKLRNGFFKSRNELTNTKEFQSPNETSMDDIETLKAIIKGLRMITEDIEPQPEDKRKISKKLKEIESETMNEESENNKIRSNQETPSSMLIYETSMVENSNEAKLNEKSSIGSSIHKFQNENMDDPLPLMDKALKIQYCETSGISCLDHYTLQDCNSKGDDKPIYTIKCEDQNKNRPYCNMRTDECDLLAKERTKIITQSADTAKSVKHCTKQGRAPDPLNCSKYVECVAHLNIAKAKQRNVYFEYPVDCPRRSTYDHNTRQCYFGGEQCQTMQNYCANSPFMVIGYPPRRNMYAQCPGKLRINNIIMRQCRGDYIFNDDLLMCQPSCNKNGEYLQSNENCTSFYVCAEITKHIYLTKLNTCPVGTGFNPDTKLCDMEYDNCENLEKIRTLQPILKSISSTYFLNSKY